MGEESNLLFMFHEGLGQASLKDLESEHLVLDCPRADEPVDNHLQHVWSKNQPLKRPICWHLPFLPDSMNSVDRLRIRRRIPCRVDEDDTVGTRYSQARSANLHAQTSVLQTKMPTNGQAGSSAGHIDAHKYSNSHL